MKKNLLILFLLSFNAHAQSVALAEQIKAINFFPESFMQIFSVSIILIVLAFAIKIFNSLNRGLKEDELSTLEQTKININKEKINLEKSIVCNKENIKRIL